MHFPHKLIVLLTAAGLSACFTVSAQPRSPKAWQALLRPTGWVGNGCPQLPPQDLPVEIVLTSATPTEGDILIGFASGFVRRLPVRDGRAATPLGDDLSVTVAEGLIQLGGALVIPLPDCRTLGLVLSGITLADGTRTEATLSVRERLLERIEQEVAAARESGQVGTSLSAARAIVQDADRTLEPGDPVRSLARFRLAEELSWSGRFEETIAAIDEALSDPMRRLPDGDYKVISALEYRAHALGYARDRAQQRQAQERVVALARENFGPGHQETLAQITTLANFLLGSGQDYVPAAVRMQEKNYVAQRSLLGPVHGDVLRSSATLQGLLEDNGELSRMRELARESYEALVAGRGARHPRTLRALNDYGGALLAAGEYEEALRVLREADGLIDEVVQGATQDTLNRKRRLHAALQATGRYAEALRFGEDLALRSARSQLSQVHTATLLRLATMQIELGQCEQAAPVLDKLVEELTLRDGPSDTKTLEARRASAQCSAELGDSGAALRELESVEQSYRLNHGPRHPRLPAVALEHARLVSRSDPAKARLELAVAIDRSRDALGSDHPAVLALELLDAELAPAASAAALGALLERARRILGPSHPAVLRLQAQAGRQSMLQGDWQEANALIDDYVAAIEAERTRLEPGRAERQSYLSERVAPYKWGVVVKLALGQTNEAFELAERAKGRGLLDALAMRRAADYAGLRPEESARLRDAEARVRAIDDRLATGFWSAIARANLLAERGAAVGAAYAVRQDLARTNPRFDRLVQVQTLDASAASRMIPADAVLVSYVIAEDQLVAFVVRPRQQLRAYVLGPWEPVAKRVEVLRSQMVEPDGTPWWRSGQDRWVQSVVAPDSDALPAQSRQIRRELTAMLIAPLWSEMSHAKRWIIAPDGALATLPFEMLPTPGTDAPVVARRTAVTYTQSASVYAASRLIVTASADRLLAFGDPDLKSVAVGAAVPSLQQTRISLALDTATVSPATVELVRLPGSRTEVRGVSRVRGVRPTDARLGSAATESGLRQLDATGELQRYRYLVFATHGLLNAELPLLSAIVLGREGENDLNDGLVTALEWTGMRLASELTVLSACDSGLGRELPGEGIMGLPFALFVAGNRQTLLSLWPVPDRSTARFITRFFELLTAGRSAVNALALTKHEFASQPGAGERVWAGFVLYGG